MRLPHGARAAVDTKRGAHCFNVMGVLPARSGHIFLNGTDLLPLPVEHRPALGVGYVPQGRQIFPF